MGKSQFEMFCHRISSRDLSVHDNPDKQYFEQARLAHQAGAVVEAELGRLSGEEVLLFPLTISYFFILHSLLQPDFYTGWYECIREGGKNDRSVISCDVRT